MTRKLCGLLSLILPSVKNLILGKLGWLLASCTALIPVPEIVGP